MKARIIKVKPWQVKFEVDGQKYLIHSSGDYETFTVLYKWDCDEKGFWSIETVNGKEGDCIPYIYHTRGTTYKNMDAEKFITDLAMRGFGPWFTETELKERVLLGKIAKLDAEVKKALETAYEKRCEMDMLKKKLSEGL